MGLLNLIKAIVSAFSCQSELERKLAQQPLLDDESFYSKHYGATAIPRDIPIRVRNVLGQQLGAHWLRICPGDKLHEIADDMDFAEIIYDIADEFDEQIPLNAIRGMDGSFDSVVRYLANSRSASQLK